MSASIWAPGGTIDVNAESTNLEQSFTTTLGQSIYNLTSFTYVPNSNSIAVYRNGQRLVKGVDWNEDDSGTSFTLASTVASTIIAGESIVAVAVIGATSANVITAAASAQAAQLAATQAQQAAQNLPNAVVGGPNVTLVTDPTGSFWQYKTESDLADWLGLSAIATTANAALPKSGGTLTGGVIYNIPASVVAASNLNLVGLAGNIIHVTGTTTINTVQMVKGQVVDIIFDGSLTLVHDNTNNNLQGAANITTAIGDRAKYLCDGTTIYCYQYIRADGTPLKNSGIVSSSVVNLAGTSTDISIPLASAKRLTITLYGMSTNGSSIPTIQLGTAGGIVATGYGSNGAGISASSAAAVSNSNGFLLGNGGISPSVAITGTLVLVNAGGNSWVVQSAQFFQSSALITFSCGGVTLSGPLTKIRATTLNGTDTFDAGTISILMES